MMDEISTNGTPAPTGGGRRPFVIGAIVGAVVAALVTAGVVLALTGGDDDSSTSSPSNTTSTTGTSTTGSPPSTSTSTSTTAPPTTTTRPPNLPPPQINGFGVNLQNCPEGAASTTVNVSYSTRYADEIQFAIDDDVVKSTNDLDGSADVGPLPCDGEQHTLTMTAISGSLRATREASLAVSSNSTVTVQ
jgi:hypothetical protein